MLFTSLALLQLGDALAVRSERTSTFTLGFTTNRFLLFAVLGTLVAQLAAIYVAPFQELLSTQSLSLGELLVVVAASSATFFAVEVGKVFHRRRPRSRRAVGHTRNLSCGTPRRRPPA